MKADRHVLPARWALQDARNRFREVIDAAVGGEDQVLTKRGKEVAVVISYEKYVRTAGCEGVSPTFATYLLDGPSVANEAFKRIGLRA